MGQFLVLGDPAIHEILIGLSELEIIQFRDVLAQCLVDFSVGSERKYQPEVAVVNRPEGQKCLFRPFSSTNSVGTKVIIDPAPTSSAAGALHGVLTLCNQDGLPTGVLNAEEITGYRTALSALIPYLWRSHTQHIVVYGAGKQALWHIRLALALRGDEIGTITVVNRSVKRAENLLVKLGEENKRYWQSGARLEYLDPSGTESSNIIKSRLAVADVIFCTVGTSAPVFRAEDVLNPERAHQPYISAVGSWQSDMLELDPKLLKHLVNSDSEAAHGFGFNGSAGSPLLVDDCDGAMQHSGEIVQSKLGKQHLLELGHVCQMQLVSSNQSLRRWLADGLVVYKSVGVSTTDLAAGNAVLALANKKGLGITIKNF